MIRERNGKDRVRDKDEKDRVREEGTRTDNIKGKEQKNTNS